MRPSRVLGRPVLRRHLVFGLLALFTLALAFSGWSNGWDPYLLWTSSGELAAGVLLSLVVVVAVAIAPWLPSAALGLVWVALLTVVVGGAPAQVALVTSVTVGFACAAWGRTATVWASGLSIPLATMVLAFSLDPVVLSRLIDIWGLYDVAYGAYERFDWRLLALLLPQVALWIPWLAGLVVRFRNRSVVATDARDVAEAQRVTAEAQRDEAADVAHLREQQAQLARDVHDVVGHSLTVILAQAQAAQFLRSDAEVRASLETIATTAQSSLEDVRRVLSATGEQATAQPPATQELHAMLDAVRASGRTVELADEGQPRPLPPDLATVAHRVLQEMVTNAVRHGVESEPIRLERHWGWDLRLEVTNAVRPTQPVQLAETQPIGVGHPGAPTGTSPAPRADGSGQGLVGMRRRLESVGGRLDVRVRSNPPTHTVTAWIPLPGSLAGAPATHPQEVRRG